VRFSPIDVQESDWECRLEPDGRVRLGLMYVSGLRAEVGKKIAQSRPTSAEKSQQMPESLRCPKCGNDDRSMIEETPNATLFCNVCAHEWGEHRPSAGTPAAEGQQLSARGPQTLASGPRYSSSEDLIARTGLRRDELATLAGIGALNAFGHDRRSALWQIERAIRPSGEMFRDGAEVEEGEGSSPLRPMSAVERVRADYAGTSLTIGPHPMALCRGDLALRGVQRASDLAGGRSGRRVRVAGAVITRQRPGTAKGFAFLTLEDETGIANIIVRPDLFTDERTTVIGAPYLLVEGTLQIQDGVTAVKAERFQALSTTGPHPQSHDYR
jgi:DNA polymerase III alpha subunit